MPEILKRLPAQINTYYEPFVGGGAVYFALADLNAFNRAELNDANYELITAYSVIRALPEKLIAGLKALSFDKNTFLDLRAQDPMKMSPLKSAIRFIYLNRTCFNGLYRVNKKGQFNVPIGDYENPKICDEENLLAISSVLKKTFTGLRSADFETAVSKAKEGDVVYADPPYIPLSATSSFTQYSADGFGLAEQIRLRDVAKKLIKKGAHVLLSNSGAPPVRELYADDCFKIEEVEAPRRVNSKATGRGNVKEVLISGVR